MAATMVMAFGHGFQHIGNSLPREIKKKILFFLSVFPGSQKNKSSNDDDCLPLAFFFTPMIETFIYFSRSFPFQKKVFWNES